MDRMNPPKVINKVVQNKFTLNVLAYRVLTRQELKWAVGEYMRINKLRSLPKSGEGTIVTIIGAV